MKGELPNIHHCQLQQKPASYSCESHKQRPEPANWTEKKKTRENPWNHRERKPGREHPVYRYQPLSLLTMENHVVLTGTVGRQRRLDEYGNHEAKHSQNFEHV